MRILIAFIVLALLSLAALAHVPVSTPDGTPPRDEPPVLDDEPLPPVAVLVPNPIPGAPPLMVLR